MAFIQWQKNNGDGTQSTYVEVKSIASGVVIPTKETSSGSTTGTQATSGTNAVMLSANTNRTGVSIINNSDQIAYIKLDDSAATTSDYTVQLPASSSDSVLYEKPSDRDWETSNFIYAI